MLCVCGRTLCVLQSTASCSPAQCCVIYIQQTFGGIVYQLVLPSRWKQQGPPKSRQIFARLHGVILQKTVFFSQRRENHKYENVGFLHISSLFIYRGPPLWSSGRSFWLQIQRSRVRFPALPDFLSSSGSGTGSTQPREVN